MSTKTSPPKNSEESQRDSQVKTPSIILPKGGGAIRGIGEKFAANPVTGTGSMTVPIAVSSGRSGFGPQLSLSYDSGSGNGPFGLGWNLSLPSITRKTDKGLPKYQDGDEPDTFILSGAEDLVPVLKKQGNDWVPEDVPDRTIGTDTYRIKLYRPRIEGLFARIERWTDIHSNETHWRSISGDNITTVYGRTTDSRIEDPEAPDGFPRVFSWLICESYDDKGNAIYYEYKPEDSAEIDLSQTNERNRTDKSRSANRCLKQIKYGNKTPVELDSNLPREFREDLSERTDWLFEVVFDYEEGHYEELPADPNAPQFVNAHKDPTQDWQRRQDPFSSFRSGFEVRTYRLCHRVLMFHHFKDELGVDDYLVRSTGFKYKEGPIASFITSVTQSGYKLQDDGIYLEKSLPPLEFEYSEANIQDKVEDVNEESLENLPQGLDGAQYQWVDIDGEGASGILTEQGDSWFYKRNVSALPVIGEDGNPHTVARFAPTAHLATIPSFTNLSGGRQQLLDLAGDGQLDVVEFDSPTPGFCERTKNEAWHTFKSFESLPNISWQDPNLKFVDLTGDGHADIFITEDEAFTWYQSLAEAGFASGEKVRQALEEEKGPKLVFADGTQSIYLADISGDGLTDLVRIRNGEVCYWPNLGYGHFGAKVTMDNSPLFDTPDLFDQRRIRLADIDGSGVTDIIYLKGDGVYIYLNESGNRWANAEKLKSFPHIDNLSSVIAVDLLGNGTACLVWSSPLPGHARKPMRYIDLMGGQKPHLLVKTVNNLGAEAHVHYAPSTRFYLEDKLAGNPWITKIPFPVHVVERVETYDRISKNRFVTRYAYHHGYFDGVEREFRGFGMVEQWDTEEYAALTQSQDFPAGDNIDESSHVPPVLTKTWFHTGIYVGRDHISDFFAGLIDAHDQGEYYREPGLTDAQARELLLDDTVLPEGLTVDEEREACRALKGSMLRQEVYALDDTDKEPHPYTVTEQNFTISCLQSRADNRHSVFFTHAREAINYHYERNAADPRIAHAMTLEVDEFGNILKEAAIGYGRRETIRVVDDEGGVDEIPNPALEELDPKDQAKQTQTLITYTENLVTNAIEADDHYRTPLPCETCTFELTGYTPTGKVGRFQISDFVQPDPADPCGRKWIHIFDGEVDYEDAPPNNRQRRLIEHLRTLYRPDDLGASLNDPLALLPLETVESLALPGETYKLAFTPGLLAQVYQRPIEGQPSENLLPNPNDILPVDLPAGQIADRGGYVDLDGNGHWWVSTGLAFHSPNSGDTAVQELTHAQQHFFLPQRYCDPFGQTSTVSFDGYDLLMVETRDALGNCVTSNNDYRVLQSTLMADPNGNRSAVAFDTLGMVVGAAVMGKEGEIEPAKMGDTLDDPTTRMEYELFNWMDNEQPNYVHTFAREQHGAANPRWQESYTYSDGSGREVMKKIQAEPGPAPQRDHDTGELVIVDGDMQMADADPRWVGSGRTIYDNKGNPVKQYEPFFIDTHEYETEQQLVEWGVTPILHYDPLGRLVQTDFPDGTLSRVVFTPWEQENWDRNDTVLESQRYVDRGAPDPGGPEPNDEQTRAAYLAAQHADTPRVAHLDALGRTFLTVDDNGQAGQHLTRVELDIRGNPLVITDALGKPVMQYVYNMQPLGKNDRGERQNSPIIHTCSTDAGERWTLNNVVGNPLLAWDSRGHTIRTTYDELQRTTHLFVHQGNDAEILAERTVYGEAHPDAEALNLRAKAFQQYDGAGVVTSHEYDFKGNLLSISRHQTADYHQTADWSLLADLTAVDEIAVAAVSLLDEEVFTRSTAYDALNRPVSLITPDNSEIRPTYNEANLLDGVEARLRGAAEWTPFVTNVDYNAKGQRERIKYGNDTGTEYTYDYETFRLTNLTTERATGENPLQNLSYIYDPVGNITAIRDDAQQTVFFNNAVVSPSAQYEYDALYRLVQATGREHIGQNGAGQPDHTDFPIMNLPHTNDGQAMRNYTEQYAYDEVGNILQMIHQANNNGNWTRCYEYADDSNRLLATSLPGDDPQGPYSAQYAYDEHGNMTGMPHLAEVQWDYKDQMQKVYLGGGGSAYYVYDAAGQRVRKVHEHNGSTVEERIYLGGYEIYRKNNGSGLQLERETLHIMDGQKRVVMIETKTVDDGTQLTDPAPHQRYQLDNHLGTACLELDDQAAVITYEEYHPYGSTSWHATRSGIEVSQKRYRYTGKEKDEETGLYYHGVRYYACWLGRWVSADPLGLYDGVNQYQYTSNNPIKSTDPTGKQTKVIEPIEIRQKEEKPRAFYVEVRVVVAGSRERQHGDDVEEIMMIGHSWVVFGALNEQTGEYKENSFGFRSTDKWFGFFDVFRPHPGAVSEEGSNNADVTARYYVGSTEYHEAFSYAEKMKERNNLVFHALHFNCVSFVSRVLRRAGINPPPRHIPIPTPPLPPPFLNPPLVFIPLPTALAGALSTQLKRREKTEQRATELLLSIHEGMGDAEGNMGIQSLIEATIQGSAPELLSELAWRMGEMRLLGESKTDRRKMRQTSRNEKMLNRLVKRLQRLPEI